jgi:hypothetical protein
MICAMKARWTIVGLLMLLSGCHLSEKRSPESVVESAGCHRNTSSATVVHAPDFSVACGDYHVADSGMTLAASPHISPKGEAALKITANGVSGRVYSPAFALTPTARTTRAVKGKDLAFLNVSYALKDRLVGGSCHIRLRIFDSTDPYEIGFEHFGGDETNVKGFTCIRRPFFAVVTTHPHKRKTGGGTWAEWVLEFEKARGDVWLGDVRVATAKPGGAGFSDAEWDAFETGDGVHYLGVAGNLFQPEYAPEAPGGYASELVMDSAHKLFRTAGFNMIRLFTYWNDSNAHYAATQHQAIIWNSDPIGGAGDYAASLEKLRTGIDHLLYYGLRTQLCFRGSPDWTHPGHRNNGAADHKKADCFANPGNPNGVGDPYPGPYYVQDHHWLYPPDDWQTWRAFAAQLAAKLKGRGVLYEVMNELDMPDQDALIGGYKAYALWLKNFYEVVKPIDPAATVLLADAGKLLPALIAEGSLQDADGVAFHLYSGDLGSVRAVVQSSGRKRHLYMSEYMRMGAPYDPALDLKKTTRQQVLWNAFSTLDFRHFSKILELVGADGEPVYGDKPAGWGDRVGLTTNYLAWGIHAGVFLPEDREGNGGDRIHAEVLCDPRMGANAVQTVVLRATNLSRTTFHDVRLWPIGFVESLGFDRNAVRSADVSLAAFSPGETREIRLCVKPRATRYPAAGIYDIGLAIVNRESKHSLALKALTLF